MAEKYLKRCIDSVLEMYLETFGAVLIEGPKWCGKTTTASMQSESIIKLQDPRKFNDYLKLAEINPMALLDGKNPRLIDEWQLAPILWNAIRAEVDDRNKEGLFILTGSTTLKNDDTMHSGTGRIARLLMRPMSLYESLNSSGQISLSELFKQNTEIDGITTSISIEDISKYICRGGWPSTIGKSDKSSQLIAEDYVNSICESEASSVDGFEKNPNRVRAVLRSYSRNISTLATNRTILNDIAANDMQISEPTLYSYLNALNRLFVIEDIPAWSPSIRSKTVIRSSNKKGIVDPSLAAASLGITPGNIFDDMKTFGFLFESLCIRDLRIYSQEIGGKVYYYRDRYGLECDAVIRLNDGKYCLIEIKLGNTDIDKGAENLTKLRNLLIENGKKPPQFLAVVSGGNLAYTRADGVKVIPITCLKN
ncbi:MAG: ATP-binding protein [Clostridia bacterium]|nr:ATP-binding protein [Clostridia bacterium]MBN2883244.1 ATP-binding protein [Clostridia bacterium]